MSRLSPYNWRIPRVLFSDSWEHAVTLGNGCSSMDRRSRKKLQKVIGFITISLLIGSIAYLIASFVFVNMQVASYDELGVARAPYSVRWTGTVAIPGAHTMLAPKETVWTEIFRPAYEVRQWASRVFSR